MSELIEEMPPGFKMTELGPLPEEWEVVNLDKIIDLKRGISWRKDEANKEGIGIPVIGIPNIKENGNIDFTDTYFLTKNIPSDKMVRINDILFVGSSGSIKNIGRNVLIKEIQQNKFTYASFTFLGRVNSLNANTVYIFYLLNSSFVDYGRYTRRASDGKYNFQLTQFKNEQKIPLPPLSEQKKIAAVLSAVQSAKEKTEDVIQATKELKKSMMKYLFTYGPVPVEEAENVPLKETEIGLMPEEWEVVRLGDLANYVNGYAFKPSDWSLKGKPIIRIQNLNDRSKPYNYFDGVIDDKYLVRNGDLLISWSASLGAFIWTGEDAWLNQHIFKVVPNDEKVDKSFLYFLTNHIIDALKQKTRGSTMKHIVKKEFLNSELAYPPLPTQQKIVSILSTIDEKIEAEENKKKALEDLFKTLLHDLMTAKIRVNDLNLNLNPDLNITSPDLNQDSEAKP